MFTVSWVTKLDYVITAIGGLVFGLLLPPRAKVVWATVLLGVGFLLVALFFAMSSSYDGTATTQLFLMKHAVGAARPGLIQLVGVGYVALIGAFIVTVKLFARSQRH